MSIGERICAALAPLGLPVAYGLMREQAQSWIVYAYGTVPIGFADDAAHTVKHLIDVHLYAPHGQNLTTLRRGIIRALIGMGATYPTVTVIANRMEEDVRQHVAFSCEIDDAAEVIGDGEV